MPGFEVVRDGDALLERSVPGRSCQLDELWERGGLDPIGGAVEVGEVTLKDTSFWMRQEAQKRSKDKRENSEGWECRGTKMSRAESSGSYTLVAASKRGVAFRVLAGDKRRVVLA